MLIDPPFRSRVASHRSKHLPSLFAEKSDLLLGRRWFASKELLQNQLAQPMKMARRDYTVSQTVANSGWR